MLNGMNEVTTEAVRVIAATDERGEDGPTDRRWCNNGRNGAETTKGDWKS